MEEIKAVITHLIQNSKPLDPDFAKVVDEEFWNLLRQPKGEPMENEIKVIDVLEQAADMSDRLQTMYDEQDECRRKSGSVSSWPRDKFESWVDSLSEDAQYILNKFYARNMNE